MKVFRSRHPSTPSHTSPGSCHKAETSTDLLRHSDLREPNGDRANTLASYQNRRLVSVARSGVACRRTASIHSWSAPVPRRTRHRSRDDLSKAYRAIERNRRAPNEVRRDRHARFAPSPNAGLPGKNRILSMLRRLLPVECRRASSSTIPPPAPCCLRHRPVSRSAVAILLSTTTQAPYCLCLVPTNAPHLCNRHYYKRPIRDTPRLRPVPDSTA